MVSAVKTEPNRLSDWLFYEEDEVGRYSRDNVKQAANTTLKSGAVVAKDGDGNIVEFTGAAGAANAAVGIVVNNLSTGATPGANVIVSRHARVIPNYLLWKAGVTDVQKTAALASLAALGVITVAQA